MTTITASNQEGPFSWLGCNRLFDFLSGSNRDTPATAIKRSGTCRDHPFQLRRCACSAAISTTSKCSANRLPFRR
jgi:hypothetical protein